MERIILHSDLNNFYASVECLYRPELRGKPVAVAGDVEKRHGIILAKNELAKKYCVSTGEPLWMAKQKCPDIIFVPPHYDLYLEYSKQARKIYTDYSDYVESYGLDECWLDVSTLIKNIAGGAEVADEIRGRIKSELGITASVGVSFNKIFAKLGSDYKKPDATTVISKDNFKQIAWPLPASDLLFVGPATKKKLAKYGIDTIGELANTDPQFLRRLLGKNGYMLWMFANGLDSSPVTNISYIPPVKSIGNSTTTPRDLVSDHDVKIILYILCESVAARLREQNLKCHTVQIFLRDSTLQSFERQMPLSFPTTSSNALFDAAFLLYKRHHIPGTALRSVGVRAQKLIQVRHEQLSFMPDYQKVQEHEQLEQVIDRLRERFGFYSIQRAVMLTDPELSKLNPKGDHVIFPERFFK